ncbi:MAG: class I SAM-dependent methyltransferase [Gammaproteobacteria bacterium]|nr:class I SAM-dependent methyltransferase [Gammaproteobacteria bacterium]
MFDGNVEFFRQPIPAEVQRRTEQIVVAAKLKPDDRVLDVGTGVGVLIPHIQLCGVRDIIGCDLSEPMLTEARKRYPGVKFWRGDVIDMPSALGPFDAIFFNAVFGNMWNQQETLRTSAGHLNRNGRIIISHPMGSAFAKELAAQDPKMIPHTLPGQKRMAELIRDLPLKVQVFRDEKHLYLCVLERMCSTSSG